MKELSVDGFGRTLPDDVHVALLSAIGAPEWHGHNHYEVWDSIAGGSFNDIEPAFGITVWGARDHARAMVDRPK